MQYMIRIFRVSSAAAGDTLRKGVGVMSGRGPSMVKNDVQVTVRPRKRRFMGFVRLVGEHRQPAGPRALQRYPDRHEKDRNEPSQPDHFIGDICRDDIGQLVSPQLE